MVYIRLFKSSVSDAPVMMEPIVDNITIVKDWLGNVYWPVLNINTLDLCNQVRDQIKTSLSTALNIHTLDWKVRLY